MRSFLAVDLEAGVKAEISSFVERLRRMQESVKWVSPENVHVTLYFFGEIDDYTLQALEGVIQEAVSGLNNFSIIIEGLSAFPSTKRPRVIWLGVRDESSNLKKIFTSVNEQIIARRLDVDREKRDYTPHITIGRLKNHPAPRLIEALERSRGISFGNVNVSEVVLFKSTLMRTGPIYEPLKVFTLGISR